MATSPVNIGSSSIDVASIVTNLVANKRKAQDAKYAADSQANTTQISAVGNFTSSLTSLQSAIKALTDGTAFKTQKVSVGDSKALTATVDSTAQPNTYKIKVDQLATAQKTMSSAFSDSKTAIGTGTLKIAIGDKSMSLDVASGANTLENVRDAINKAKDNPGVTASIVTGSDGAHLVLTSVSTGAANAFTVTTSGGDGGLAQLDFDPATGTAQTPAADAVFWVDGVKATSASNTATSAIDGVTLSLTAVTPTNPDQPTTLTITNDPGAVTTALNSLVTAYNSFIATYKQLTKYDQTNQQVGALIGDATVNSIKSQVATVLGSQFAGNTSGPRSLSDLGVAFQTDGTLKLDTNKLTKVMANNPKEAQSLLSGDNGVAPKLDKLIAGWTASNGILTQRTANLQNKAKDIKDEMAAFDVQMDDYSKRLTKQYSALDAMMTKLAGTSSYLQQQFDALTASK
ncbi:flagellar hook-associated protein 2 [Luteibacter sp. UNC138MFCol5.1]|uniref:flagellar filament capping protein FliD n=1 Tax=Luteibacter sp. UNC138MFCol5.1 TaxID=1502774 RepID=UPI0008AC2CFA|nr:flagellar filament capping protein FliD [Luteibacter sp. UNC138MFCol5.1]SEO66841.1 flagellar hook-associated protein 2 [Luteibacter sp. UNC138MFCol5.1]